MIPSKLNILKYFMIFFFLYSAILYADEKIAYRRHYLILYDNSYPFFSLEEKTPKIKKTLLDLFLNKVPSQSEGYVNNLLSENNNKIKFFDS